MQLMEVVQMRNSIRQVYLFIQAYACVLRVHHVLRSSGFEAVRLRFLRPWLGASRELRPDDDQVSKVVAAVSQACEWLPFRAECLHRSTAVYWLLRKHRARPRFVMAV